MRPQAMGHRGEGSRWRLGLLGDLKGPPTPQGPSERIYDGHSGGTDWCASAERNAQGLCQNQQPQGDSKRD